MKDEPTLKNKLSPLIQGQLPDFLQHNEHQIYAHFVRDFYQFLESARMKFSFTTKVGTHTENKILSIFSTSVSAVQVSSFFSAHLLL